jgi:hypothetical protein
MSAQDGQGTDRGRARCGPGRILPVGLGAHGPSARPWLELRRCAIIRPWWPQWREAWQRTPTCHRKEGKRLLAAVRGEAEGAGGSMARAAPEAGHGGRGLPGAGPLLRFVDVLPALDDDRARNQA